MPMAKHLLTTFGGIDAAALRREQSSGKAISTVSVKPHLRQGGIPEMYVTIRKSDQPEGPSPDRQL
jgi:hypothetical protein